MAYHSNSRGAKIHPATLKATMPSKCQGRQEDGGGPWTIERITEEVYLHAYASVPEARAGISRYFDFYNSARLHSSLSCRTPDDIYFHQPLTVSRIAARFGYAELPPSEWFID